jgi:hypothetical protein
MDDFGGIVMALDGAAVNLVRDYGAGYSRRPHARQIRAVLKRWSAFLTAGRDWRLFAHSPWEHRSMPVDAHFDDHFWFFFRSREEMARFRARYRTSIPLRRVGGKWQRTRL